MELVSELIYANYAYNRRRFPDRPARDWTAIFINVTEMEKRFQEEENVERMAGSPKNS